MGYEPVIATPLEYATAQSTLAVTYQRGRAEKLQSIVWLPFVHQEEQMTAYHLVRTPTRLQGDYMELSPEQ